VRKKIKFILLYLLKSTMYVNEIDKFRQDFFNKVIADEKEKERALQEKQRIPTSSVIAFYAIISHQRHAEAERQKAYNLTIKNGDLR
jgi:hypothetical protein